MEKAIASGLSNPDSDIGLYAGDPESYAVFAQLFEPVIAEYHQCSQTVHQDLRSGMVETLTKNGNDKHILSTRIRVARNIVGFGFTPQISLDKREELEARIVDGLSHLRGEFSGSYYSLESIDDSLRSSLSRDRLLFSRGDRFQEAAGINRDFPLCRGVYLSHDRRLRIWVNEEDHLRIICQDSSSHLYSLFAYFCRVHQKLEKLLPFVHNKRLGYLTSCPTNIGTSMRAGMHVHLPRLNQNRTMLDRLAGQFKLQIRGTGGEKTPVNNDVVDISNHQRLGVSELDIVHLLNSGIEEILKREHSG